MPPITARWIANCFYFIHRIVTIMAEQKGFRFRLPWLVSSTPSPRPAAPPPRPAAPLRPSTTQAPAPTTQPTPAVPVRRPPFRPSGLALAQPPPPPQAQPLPRDEAQSTTIQAPAPTTQPTVETQPSIPTTAQRPPFRPAGIAPSQTPPTQGQASARTGSQPSSPPRRSIQVSSQPAPPSRATTQSPAAAQLSSPSRGATPQPRAGTLLSSPSRPAPQSQVTSQTASEPRSPSRLATQPGERSSLPSSPSLAATKMEPTREAASQPASPVETLQPTTQQETRPPPIINEPKPSGSEKEDTKSVEPLEQSLEAQSRLETKSETVSKPVDQPPPETIIQPNVIATPPAKDLGMVEAIAPASVAKEMASPPQKRNSSPSGSNRKPLPESGAKPEETEEWKQEVQRANEEEKQKRVTELSTEASRSNEHTKEPPSVAFQEEPKQLEKHEFIGRKEMLSTSISPAKLPKTVISNNKDKSPVGGARQKPAIPNGERVHLHKEIMEDISKFAHKMAIAHPRNPIEGKLVSVITLAGENRGASMQLGSQSAKREGAVHIHRGYKVNLDESAEATTDGEGSSKGRWSKDANNRDQTTKEFINSNIQGINNSIMFNSSITEGNPGVRLLLSRKQTEPTKPSNRTESLAAHKAEFEITPAQKLTYDPAVRRRCLRGLFIESSDSDPDNPEKPRRHGCHHSCPEKGKDD